MKTNGAKNQTAGKTARTLEAMRLSLIAARKLNNKKAISRDFVGGNPATKNPDKLFETWCHEVANLYRAIEPWAVTFNDADAKDADLSDTYEVVTKLYTELGEKLDPKIWTRTNDVHRIVGFMLETTTTTKGTTDFIVSPTTFRKKFETLLGVRLAQSAVLTEEEADLVKRYDKTQQNLAKAQARLDGSENAKGEHRPGLQDNLKTAEAKLAEVIELAKGLGVAEADIEDNPLIKGYADAVDDIVGNIAKTKKKIAEYETYLKDNKKGYDNIMKKVNEITA